MVSVHWLCSLTVRQGSVEANGLQFSYLEDGPSDGPLALCLHGFPDSAHTWRYLLPALGGAGYHAVAPWMRGYAPTAVPADGRYQTGALVADAGALHEALRGDGRAIVIGHDWGSSAAYGAGSHQPERWSRVVGLAVPPPGALGGGFLTYNQLKRSWYMFFFQSPLADIAVPMDDLAFIERLWTDWSPGYDGSEDLPHVKDSLRAQPNLAAALGYYRAMFDRTRHDATLAAVQGAADTAPARPYLYLHGANDGCLGAELARGAAATLPEGSRFVMVDGAGHFLHVERPDEVNRHILDFVTS